MKTSNKPFNLRKNYPLFFEIGLIAALLIFIGALKFHLPVKATNSIDSIVQDEPPIVLSPITIEKKTPVPPVLSRIPAAIPDDSPMDPPAIEFADFDDPGSIMPLPPENIKEDEPEILDQVEFMPAMKGGIKALYNDITYPEAAIRAGIEGTVEVKFVVNEKGEVINPEITRGIGGGCDQEALKAIQLQSYTPGIQNGRFVKVRMKQVVHFRLN